MDFITISDHKIPALGYGTWKLAGADCIRGVEMALGHGYRHIDTAQIYENEAEVSTAVKNSGVGRENVFLTTKVWMSSVDDGALQKSVQESLKKLKTDYVDLLLIHWPVNDVPFARQMKALTEVQGKGLTKMIGVSNFTVAQMKHVHEELGAPIVSNQVEYHPFLSQTPVLDYLRAHDMFLTAYSPVARGQVLDNKTLQDIAAAHNKSVAQVTLRWLLQQGRVAAIPKAGSEKHLKENFAIFDFMLTNGEMDAIHALARSDGRMINPQWAPAWDKAA